MTEQEKFETEIRLKLAVENEKFNSILNAIQQQREDMSQMQSEMKSLQAKHDADLHEINQRFYDKLDANQREFTKQLHNNFVQTLLGVGAIMAAVGGLIISVVK